jgi:hypothetical protein
MAANARLRQTILESADFGAVHVADKSGLRVSPKVGISCGDRHELLAVDGPLRRWRPIHAGPNAILLHSGRTALQKEAV